MFGLCGLKAMISESTCSLGVSPTCLDALLMVNCAHNLWQRAGSRG